MYIILWLLSWILPYHELALLNDSGCQSGVTSATASILGAKTFTSSVLFHGRMKYSEAANDGVGLSFSAKAHSSKFRVSKSPSKGTLSADDVIFNFDIGTGVGNFKLIKESENTATYKLFEAYANGLLGTPTYFFKMSPIGSEVSKFNPWWPNKKTHRNQGDYSNVEFRWKKRKKKSKNVSSTNELFEIGGGASSKFSVYGDGVTSIVGVRDNSGTLGVYKNGRYTINFSVMYGYNGEFIESKWIQNLFYPKKVFVDTTKKRLVSQTKNYRSRVLKSTKK